MSVYYPDYIVYLTSPSDPNISILIQDLQSLRATKSVSASIGSFEIKVPHGTNPDFTKYANLEPFQTVQIWLGSDTGSLVPTFAGKIDTVRTELDPQAGYVTTLSGRDIGEVLYRYVVRKNYYGFFNLYPSGSADLLGLGTFAGLGTKANGWNVHIVTDKAHIPQGDNRSTIINFQDGAGGPSSAGYLYIVRPYVTQQPLSAWNTPYSTTPVLPDNNTIQKWGLVSDRMFTLLAPNCLITLKYINWAYDILGLLQTIPSHSGFTWIRMWGVDDTGSMSNLTRLSDWVCNLGAYSPDIVSGAPLIFSPVTTNVGYDTLLVPFTTLPINQYIYFEMIWQVVDPAASAYGGVILDMANSVFSIPTNEGMATNVLEDLISPSNTGMTEITPGNTRNPGILNTTPITISYDAQNVFDCLKDVCDTINYDFFITANYRLQVYPRQTNFTDTILTAGENILDYKRNYDLGNVKNYIWVRGAQENIQPADGDDWTEISHTGWNGDGTGSGRTDIFDFLMFPIQKQIGSAVGNYNAFFKPHTGPATNQDDILPDGTCVLLFYHPIPSPIELRTGESGSLAFYLTQSDASITNAETYVVRLKSSPDDFENYFQANVFPPGDTNWHPHVIPMGEDYTTDKTGALWDSFVKYGNPQWKNMKYIEFYFHYNPGSIIPPYPGFLLDGLNIGKTRWSGSAMDQDSINKYGFRYYEETSNDYHSDEECLARAQRYLLTKKNPINQLSITITGSETILPGDRIKVYFPSDGMTGSDGTGAWFDVIELTHTLSPTDGYLTELQLSDQKYVRSLSELKDFGVQRYYDKLDTSYALRGLRVIK